MSIVASREIRKGPRPQGESENSRRFYYNPKRDALTRGSGQGREGAFKTSAKKFQSEAKRKRIERIRAKLIDAGIKNF